MPSESEWALFAICGESIHEVKRIGISIPIHSLPVGELSIEDRHNIETSQIPTSVSSDQSLVAFAPPSTDDQRHAGLIKVNSANREIIGESMLAFPKGFSPKCLCFHGNRLFVAGGGPTSQAGYFDLNDDPLKWKQLKLPFPNWNTRKEIDALLSINSRRIVLVDNIVYPKYLIDCDTTSEPTANSLIELPNHGTYERIERAACGKRWLAILSRTGSMEGPRIHVSIMAKNTLAEHAWIFVVPTSYRRYMSKRSADDFKPEYRDMWEETYKERHLEELASLDEIGCREWHDIIFRGDTLLFAAGEDGLGRLDLTNEQPVRSRQSCSETFSNRCTNKLKYNLIDGQRSGDHVIGLSPIEANKVVAIILGEQGFRNQLVAI